MISTLENAGGKKPARNRIKIELPQIQSRDEAEAVMNDLANTANNKRKLVARLDAAVLQAQEAAAPGIAACDDAIKAKSDALRAWAEANPEAFGKKKSIAFLAGTLGFRTGTPKVALLSRAWTWGKVLEAINARAFQFVRTSEEVDKDAILAFVASPQDATDAANIERNVLTPIGVKVVQEESFFVEPNLTDAEGQP